MGYHFPVFKTLCFTDKAEQRTYGLWGSKPIHGPSGMILCIEEEDHSFKSEHKFLVPVSLLAIMGETFVDIFISINSKSVLCFSWAIAGMEGWKNKWAKLTVSLQSPPRNWSENKIKCNRLSIGTMSVECMKMMQVFYPKRMCLCSFPEFGFM